MGGSTSKETTTNKAKPPVTSDSTSTSDSDSSSEYSDIEEILAKDFDYNGRWQLFGFFPQKCATKDACDINQWILKLHDEGKTEPYEGHVTYDIF